MLYNFNLRIRYFMIGKYQRAKTQKDFSLFSKLNFTKISHIFLRLTHICKQKLRDEIKYPIVNKLLYEYFLKIKYLLHEYC